MAGMYTCQVTYNETGEEKNNDLEIRVYTGDIPSYTQAGDLA